MAYRRGLRIGDYLIRDDLTGQRVYASETVKDYRGNIVHRKNLLKRNMQDFVRVIPDGKPVNPVRDTQQVSPLRLYPEFVGNTNVPTPVGPATHLYNAGIGRMEIGLNFIVR